MQRVIIVGAGLAGLFAAHELADSGLEIVIVDMGKDISRRHCNIIETGLCTDCQICDVICGVGGAGGMSDGKLNLHPQIGGNLLEHVSEEKAWELLNKVEELFCPDTIDQDEYNNRWDELVHRAAGAGIEYIPIKQRHIGSDKLPQVIQRIKRNLERKGVKFQLNTRIEEVIVENGMVTGVRDSKGNVMSADFVILGVGRAGTEWMEQVARDLGLTMEFMPIDIGVRVEVPAVVYEDLVEINWDPKFRMHTPSYDDMVRTFCTCPYGFVIKDTYSDVVGVNGHSMMEERSENTNFAFLVRVNLTEPVENTTAYGLSIAHLANTIGGGKPLLQRLGDLRRGRRSTWSRISRSYVKPTLRDVTPGDISMAMPHRIVTDILEGLEMLDRVVEGVASDSTLIYAPEIKFSAMRVKVGENFETDVRGLYTVGDGAGMSRSLVTAGCTGILAAEGIKKHLGLLS